MEWVAVCSEDNGTGYADTAGAVLAALPALEPGDVLLIEAQLRWRGSLLPIEWDPLVFEMIRLATALGITVVEPAGNGGRRLDGVSHRGSGREAFDRRRRDSGAIVVGAAGATVPHLRLDFSNWGDIVDCYGWGEGVVTAGGDAGNALRGAYNFNYGGTSAAAAIVAGAALCLQGIARASGGGPIAPRRLRAILGDRRLGTPSADPGRDRIGVMPDLGSILSSGTHRRRFERRRRRRAEAGGRSRGPA